MFSSVDCYLNNYTTTGSECHNVSMVCLCIYCRWHIGCITVSFSQLFTPRMVMTTDGIAKKKSHLVSAPCWGWPPEQETSIYSWQLQKWYLAMSFCRYLRFSVVQGLIILAPETIINSAGRYTLGLNVSFCTWCFVCSVQEVFCVTSCGLLTIQCNILLHLCW